MPGHDAANGPAEPSPHHGNGFLTAATTLDFSLGFAANNLYNKPRENRAGAAVMPQGGKCAILGRDIATACKKAT